MSYSNLNKVSEGSNDSEIENIQIENVVVKKAAKNVFTFDDDPILKKRSPILLLGPFLIAVLAILIIFTGQLVLSTRQASYITCSSNIYLQGNN